MVVFTSDNGFLIGDHGLIDKRNAYQGSVRVPLLVWQPGSVPAGVTNPGRVRNLDFAPTFLDDAGVRSPAQFEGKSALSLMTGKIAAKDWAPQDFIYEYYWEWSFPMTPGTFAIQRGDLKYIQYYGVYDTDELYDLARDPDERTNLINDPAYFQAKLDLRKALYAQLADRQGRHSIPYSQRQAIGSVRRLRTGPGAAQFSNEWLVEPNRPDRLDDILADSPAKAKAKTEGRPFMPVPRLGQEKLDEK